MTIRGGLRLTLGLIGLLTVLACSQYIRNSGTSAVTPPAPATALRLATYNVHYIVTFRETGAWSMADWARRKGPLDLAFKEMEADIVGFQEMESFSGGSVSATNLTLTFLLENNPSYAAAAQGDPQIFPSTQPIFYRTDRLKLLDQGWFFFSDTPDVIYARTFNGSYPAFASWALFADKTTGRELRVVNLHTDFRSRSNRLQSVELVAQRLTPWVAAQERVIIMGDFNARLGDRTLAILEAEGVTFSPVRGATYHFNRGLNLFGAIDHIGWMGGVTPAGPPQVIRRKFDGEWPTDHYPVLQDVLLDP